MRSRPHAANDNVPQRPRLVPVLGVLDLDAGRLEPAAVVQLIHEDMLRPFVNDHREA